MAVRQIQSVFTLGELDERLFARSDFAGYFKGAKKLRDVMAIPQGGAIRRFGTDYVTTIVDTGDANEPVTDTDEVNGHVFNYSNDKQFTVIVRPHDRTGTPGVAFEVYLNKTLQQILVANTGPSEYAITDIVDMFFFSYDDRIIILHPNRQPRQLKRISDSSWQLSIITFGNLPTYDFSVIDDDSYRGSTVTFTPDHKSGTGRTLTAVNYTFNAGHVGGTYAGGGGVARITAVAAGGASATIDINTDFTDTSAIKGSNSFLNQAAWGDYSGGTPAGENRGWPTRGGFFQNRMFLANTPVLPRLLFASNITDFYNFDDSEPNATNSFSYGLSDEINSIVGNKGLIGITRSTIEATSIFIDTPLTAQNVFFNIQANDGSSGVEAKVVDNQVMFVDYNNQRVNSAQYTIDGGFISNDISVLSPQVISTPTSSGNYRSTTNSGEFLLLTNTDGTIACLQSLAAQEVSGWTLLSTQGSFEQILSDGIQADMIVRRKVNTGSTVAGAPDNVLKANADFDSFVDITSDSQSASSDVEMFGTEGSYIVIGSEAPFNRVSVTLNTNANTSIEPTFEFLDQVGSWEEFTPTDGTTGFTGNGTISWDFSDTSSWYPKEFPGTTADGVISQPLRKFWVRIKRTEIDASLTTPPVEDTIYINTANRLHLEELDFDTYMDSTETTTSDANGLITGLDHLIGQQVYAIVDSVPDGPHFVDDSGEITIGSVSSTATVGINYFPKIEPMPVVAEMAFGESIYHPKHIKSIYVDFYKSLGILVNDVEIQGITLNQSVLNATPIPQTDFVEIAPMRGWNPRATNIISQERPLPMTVIGLGYRLEIS